MGQDHSLTTGQTPITSQTPPEVDPADPNPGNRVPADPTNPGVTGAREGTVISDGSHVPEVGPGQQAPVPIGHLGHYALLQKLGQGGMGAVYRARHERLDKMVAIKILPPDCMNDPQAVSRFQREMRAVGKLQHPNIVIAHDAGESNDCHFLVMELIDGCDLGALARENGPLPVPTACELIRQAAIGLQHVYELGLVHRDIKPSNLMLAHAQRGLNPTVKILDMGLALLEEVSPVGEELTSTGQVMGTLDYMAPEQSTDTHTVDIRADLYSLGASLFRLLVGRPPLADMRHSSILKKLSALANEKPPDVRTLRPDCPEALAILISRLLSKNPEERPFPPIALAAELAPFCDGADLKGLLEGTLPKWTVSASNPPPSSINDCRASQLTAKLTDPKHMVSASHGNGNRFRWKIASAAAVGAFSLGTILVILANKEGPEPPVQIAKGSDLAINRLTSAAETQITPDERARSSTPSTPSEPVTLSESDLLRRAVTAIRSAGGSGLISIDNGSGRFLESAADLDQPLFAGKQLGLRSVFFLKRSVPMGTIQAIADLKSVGTLSFVETDLDDDGLLTLSSIRQLNTLQLVNNQVTSAGVVRFASTPRNTKVLYLHLLPLTVRDLREISQGLQELTSLHCAGIEASPQLSRVLSGFPHLTSLTVRGQICTPQFMKDLLRDCPNVSEIGLQGHVTHDSVQAIAFNPKITSLLFDKVFTSDPGTFSALKLLSQLKKITISRELSASEWEEFVLNFNQPQLEIARSKIAQEQIERLSQVKTLRSLQFTESAYDAERLDQLLALHPDLSIVIDKKEYRPNPDSLASKMADRAAAEWVLSVGGEVDVKPADNIIRYHIRHPEALPKGPFRLYGINLTGKNLTLDGLKLIAALPSIYELRLDGTDLDDAGLEALSPLKEVANFRVPNTKVTESALIHFSSRNRNTSVICLNGIPLTAQGLSKMGPRFPNVWLLEVGKLKDTQSLAVALETFPLLGKLFIDSELITPQFVRDMKNHCSKVTALGLRGETTSTTIHNLGAHPQMTSVSFSPDSKFDQETLSAFKEVPRLRSVTFARSLTAPELSTLIECSAIETVSYFHPPEAQPNLESFVKMKSLKKLSLLGVNPEPGVFESIARQRPDLQILHHNRRWTPPGASQSPKNAESETPE